MKRDRKKKQRGFTLVEIMVVIVIIGLVMGVVAVSAMDSLQLSRQDTARIELSRFISALELYSAKKGSYPDESQGLKALETSRLIKELHDDPWGQPYIYALHDGEPVITSLGRDGAPGGDGYDADLKSSDPR